MNKKQLSKNLSIVALIVFLCLVPVIIKSNYWLHVFIIIAINILVAVSLRTIFLTGEVCLGIAGFMLLGGYASALLTLKAGLSFWVAMPLGGLFAAAVALVLGYPFFRVRGIYFAILTLVIAVIFQYVAGYWDSLTTGWHGLTNIPFPDPITLPLIGTITFDTHVAYYYLSFVIIGLSLLILYRMEQSRIGTVWGAIKESDGLAQSVGINIIWHKIFIFSIACFFSGIAGSLFAHYVHALSPANNPGNQFAIWTSLYAIVYMVVGGEASFAGPIIGAALLMIIPELARPLQEFRPLVNGGVMILIVFFMPGGLTRLPDIIRHGKLFGRLRKNKTNEVYS
jgi:branched-chain amino acid transport system permease protein